MTYKIFYSPQAQKYLLLLTPSKVLKIIKRIEYVSLDPYKADNNIVKLAGTKSSFRLRIGDIRVIYQLDTRIYKLYIFKIAPRGSAYS